MKRIKKIATALLLVGALTGCIYNEFRPSEEISLLAREDGSGTRGTFTELFQLEQRTGDGGRKDLTTKEAIVVNKTGAMIQSVQNNYHALGYVSIGALNNSVKPVLIDGIEPTAENIANGTYSISRPFNIAIKDVVTENTADFIDFIFSKEGQEIVVDFGYVAVDTNAPLYAGHPHEGRIDISGSSSVAPVMEKLQEAYLRINPHIVIEMQISDSSTGMADAIGGTCDIGMASRELKESEKEFLVEKAIALDGIAIIVHPENPIKQLTASQVTDIFTDKIRTWKEVL